MLDSFLGQPLAIFAEKGDIKSVMELKYSFICSLCLFLFKVFGTLSVDNAFADAFPA